MFEMPLTTEYDARFRLLGIPVRINPFFWAMAAILGWEGRKAPELLAWIACVFVSILVHEFGHALATVKLFRQRPSVLLYYMGGLCSSSGEQADPARRALVILMGPIAGFVLFALTLVLGLWILGVADIPLYGWHEEHPLPEWFVGMPRALATLSYSAYSDLLRINLLWGLFNLLPIYPLDGGQLAQVALTVQNRREGVIRSHILGMVVAGLLAVYFFSIEQKYTGFFVASLALMNYQSYQAARAQRGSFRQFDDDDSWWRK